MITDEQDAWLKSTLKINVKHAEVETDVGNEQGFIPQPVGKAYKDEESKFGWRAGGEKQGATETDAAYAKRMEEREKGHMVTRHYDDAEQAASKRPVDEKGKARTADGLQADGKFIYVTDPDTGDLYVAPPNDFGLRKLGADGNPEGDVIKPARMSPNLMVAMEQAKASHGAERLEMTHHSTPLRGGDVASAGEVKFEGGKVKEINNSSGHYKPQFKHLLQVVEHLMANGAMLDTEVVDHKGEAIKDTHPKAYQLYRKLTPMLAELPAERVRLAALEKKLDDGELDELEAAQVNGLIAASSKKLDTVQRAMQAMAKMGIGSRNAMSDDTKVGVMNITPDMTGRQAREVKADEMSVADFVMGRGATDGIAESKAAREGEDEESVISPYLMVDDMEDSASPYDDLTVGSEEDDEFASGEAGLGLDAAADPYAERNAANAARVSPGYSDPEELSSVSEDDSSEDESSEEDSDDSEDGGDEAKVPYRDFAAKGAVLDQLHKVAKEKKLRPEDRADAEKTVLESEAPEVDEAAWSDQIDALADEIDELAAAEEDEAEDGVEEGGDEYEMDARGYSVPKFAASADGTEDDEDEDEDEVDERGYAVFKSDSAADEAEDDQEDLEVGQGGDAIPRGLGGGADQDNAAAGYDDLDEAMEVDDDGYAVFTPSKDGP